MKINSSPFFATGLDFIKHGEVAYPNKSQGDGWHNLRPRYNMELATHRPTVYLKQHSISISSVKGTDESKTSNELPLQLG